MEERKSQTEELQILLEKRQLALKQRADRLLSQRGVNYETALLEVPTHILPDNDPQRIERFNFGFDAVIFKIPETFQEQMRMLITYQCVYKEYGYLPAEYDVTKPDEWHAFSIPIIGVTEGGKVIATTRLIRADSNGLFPIYYVPEFGKISLGIDEKLSLYGNHLPTSKEEIDKTVEISALALIPEAYDSKDHSVLKGLCKAILNHFEDHGIRHAYASIDTALYKLLVSFGFVLERIGKPAYYLGSMTVPVYFEIERLLETMREGAFDSEGKIIDQDRLDFYNFIKSRKKSGFEGIFSYYRSNLTGDL